MTDDIVQHTLITEAPHSCKQDSISSQSVVATMSTSPQHSSQEPHPEHQPPVSLTETIKKLETPHFDNANCKKALKALKISGAVNAKICTKRKLLAMKLIQRQIPVAIIMEHWEDHENSSNANFAFVRNLPQTTVRIRRTPNGNEFIDFVKGDVPKVTNGEVVIGEPALETIQSNSCASQVRRPAFEAAEYCRLLHVLADSRMTTARTKLMECMNREELDIQRMDPWCDSIGPLFNDLDFKPAANHVLSGGVALSDISVIDPALRPYEREGGVLKRKFAEFKSCYGQCISRYQASGQGDPEAFPYFAEGKAYIMYAYCFLKLHPILQPFMTRAMSSASQREEGVGEGVSPFGYGGNDISRTQQRRARRDVHEISVRGMDSLVSALKAPQQYLTPEIETFERRRLQFEVLDAQARSTTSSLEAIARVKDLLDQAPTEEEKDFFRGILHKLKCNLQSGL